MRTPWTITLLVLIALATFSSHAGLIHRYSFTNSINDSVGTANGTLFGHASLTNGMLHLDGTTGAYLGLPGGILNGLTSVSIEAWVAFGNEPVWTRLFDFGTTDAGGNGANYLGFSSHSGAGDFRLIASDADPGYNHEQNATHGGNLDNVGQVHIACVFDPPNHVSAFYTNGVLVAINNAITIPLASISNVFSYVGKSLFNGDPPLRADIAEFRMYNQALTGPQVAANFVLGPNKQSTNPVQNTVLGSLKREIYTNIAGVAVSDVTNNPLFPLYPDISDTVSSFESQNLGDSYGQRLSGFLTPPASGGYVFYLASDDASELWLSTDSSAANKQLIVSEPLWNIARNWLGQTAPWDATVFMPGRSSGAITLQAGHSYYVEAVHKQGFLGNSVAVAWHLPGGVPPANGSAPIGSQFLSYETPSSPLVIESQPAAFEAMLGETVRLRSNVYGTSPIHYQWFLNGIAVAGGTTPQLVVPEFTASVAGDYILVAGNASGSVTSTVARVTQAATFQNPILPTGVDTADPWIIFQDGYYYLIGEEFNKVSFIFMRKSKSLVGLRSAIPVQIAVPNAAGFDRCIAPELHFVSGKWYVYFHSANTSRAWSDRMFVAESTSSGPEGPYVLKGQLIAPGADFWGSDVSVLEQAGQLYLLWSGISGPGDLVSALAAGDKTRIFIAPLSNPWTISGARVQLSVPSFPWESVINEAPEALVHNGKLHIVYSAYGFDADYCLGLLSFNGGNVLDPSAWSKSAAPLFRRYSDAQGEIVGTGHCAFTKSPDGTEDWIVFHNLFPSNVDPNNVNSTRQIRFQPVAWNSNDDPFFGHPFPAPLNIPGPSGEAAPLALPNTGTGLGLQADYFTNSNLIGPSLSRVDPAVDFDWWSGAPVPVPNGDNFSVRWSGFVEPRYAETYTFHTLTDDGVRLWINGQLLVNDWNGHPVTENTGMIALAAGQLYSIRMEYFEATGDASARLYWSSPSLAEEIIPQSQLYAALPTNSPPNILSQTSSQTVTVGATASFSVVATGTPAPRYQWQLNGTNIPGATSSIYMISPVTLANAGTYAVLVTNVAGGSTTTGAVLTVTKVNQAISFAQTPDKTYGATAFTLAATANSGLPVTLSVISGPATINGVTVTLTGAGLVTIRASQAGNDIYNPAADFNQSFSVGQATLTVRANDAARAYSTANPAFTVSYSGFVNGDTAAVLSGAPQLNTVATPASPVGSYAISVAQGTLSAANYLFAFANGTLTVTPAGLTVTANSTNRVYGAANPPVGGGLVGLQNGDSITVTFLSSALPSSPVGAYAILPVLADPGSLLANYIVTTNSGTLIVTPASLRVSAGNTNRAYGAANPGFTASYIGFLNGDTVAMIAGSPQLTSVATPASPVASYPINAAQGTLGATNYLFTFANGTLTVIPAGLTLTVNSTNRVYGASSPSFTGGLVGLQNSDNITATFSSGAVLSSPVGTYAILPALADPASLLANYSVTTNSGTLTVTPASLTVTVGNTNRIYGAANPAFTASYSGFLNGDTAKVLSGAPQLTTVVTPASPVASYAITGAQGTLSATNYLFTFANGTLTVTLAGLTVTANSTNRVYGSANPALTGSLAGLQNSDSISAVFSSRAVPSSPVGTYPILPTLADPGSLLANYTVTTNNGTLTVAPATLTITADNTNRVYGSANPAFTSSYGGFLNGDTATVLSGNPQLTTVATPSSPVASYAITAAQGTLSATNYLFAFVNGALSVTASGLTVTANSTNRVYGAANPLFTGGLAGLLNNDNIVATFTSMAVPSSPVGTYPILPTLADPRFLLANYAVATNSGILTVTQAGLIVTVNNTNRILGAQNPAFTGAISGLKNSDSITVVYSCNAVTNSPVGTYNITAILVDPKGNLPNYSVSTNGGILTITNPGSGSVTITTPIRVGQIFSLSIQSQTGTNYTLQSKNALTDANWSDVETVTGSGGQISLTDPAANTPTRLYRVRISQ